MTPYDRLKQLNLELLTPAVPVANYVPFVLANGFLYLSGQGPRRADGGQFTGKQCKLVMGWTSQFPIHSAKSEYYGSRPLCVDRNQPR